MDPDSSQNRGVPGLVALSIVMIVLPTFAIALRIWARLISKSQRFWWDDWFAIGSLPFSIAQMALELKMISEGLGRHQGELALEQVIEVARCAYANTFFYDIVISLPKYSAVFFYIRIFPINSKVFRISVWVTNALITAHLFASVLLLVFQCYPLKIGWQPATTGHCIHNFHPFLAIWSLSVIIDIVIMLIPLPIVWSLKTGLSRKLMLTGIFFCAYCVIVISLARLIVYAQIAHTFRADFTWNTIPYDRWIGCEGPVSIVSICAPNIFHLCKRARCHGLSSLFTRREYHAKIQDRLNKNLKSPPTLDEELLGADKDGTVSSRTDGVYSVGAPAEDRFEEGSTIAMVDRTHLRRDRYADEEERWSQCAVGMGNSHLK